MRLCRCREVVRNWRRECGSTSHRSLPTTNECLELNRERESVKWGRGRVADAEATRSKVGPWDDSIDEVCGRGALGRNSANMPSCKRGYSSRRFGEAVLADAERIFPAMIPGDCLPSKSLVP